MNQRIKMATAVLCFSLLLVSCGGDDSTPTNSSTGGTPSTGNNSIGGTPSTGDPSNETNQGATTLTPEELLPQSVIDMYGEKGFTLTAREDKVWLIKYEGDDEVVDIPDFVQVIYSNAFQGGTMTTVNIPDSVIEIGGGAFQNCENLRSLVIPEGVTEILIATFYNCYALESVTIPSTVTTIGMEAFAGCESLTSIEISENITTIQQAAFLGTGITSIVIPDTVTDLDTDSLFRQCKNLVSVTLPSHLTEIGNYMFAECSSLEHLSIPGSVESIGSRVFDSCGSLLSIEFMDGFEAGVSESTFKNARYPDTIIVTAGSETEARIKEILPNARIMNP